MLIMFKLLIRLIKLIFRIIYTILIYVLDKFVGAIIFLLVIGLVYFFFLKELLSPMLGIF